AYTLHDPRIELYIPYLEIVFRLYEKVGRDLIFYYMVSSSRKDLLAFALFHPCVASPRAVAGWGSRDDPQIASSRREGRTRIKWSYEPCQCQHNGEIQRIICCNNCHLPRDGTF
ncbi:hypothetical protein SFRURICE_019718, partial [Spodoptera frugiperda]